MRICEHASEGMAGAPLRRTIGLRGTCGTRCEVKRRIKCYEGMTQDWVWKTLLSI